MDQTRPTRTIVRDAPKNPAIDNLTRTRTWAQLVCEPSSMPAGKKVLAAVRKFAQEKFARALLTAFGMRRYTQSAGGMELSISIRPS